MQHIKYLYDGDKYWWHLVRAHQTEEEIIAGESKITETTLKIQSLYDAGTPVYTRGMIEDVDRQLGLLASAPQADEENGSISVMALDQGRVDFKVESGFTLPGGSTVP